jgi:glycosyltransferase involved in cell wall biosynthesis
MTPPRKRICFVSTVPYALDMFMRPHLRALAERYDVTLVTSGPGDELADLLGPHIAFHSVRIDRKISLPHDAAALRTLTEYFRRERFDAVHSITPKAGLLAMTAAWLARVPVRIHLFTGQVWATKRGVRRTVLRNMDRLLAHFATELFADSHSQRAFLVEEGVVSPDRIRVLEEGSVSGVDTRRFAFDPDARRRVRAEHGIPESAVLFLFIGRVNRDKGVHELTAAFASVARTHPNVHLLLAGPDEEGLEATLEAFASRFPGRVHRVGFVKRPQDYMSAAEVLCLPSHREGFGTILIEAGAVGLPTIASRIYGITDASVDGVTGILHAPGDERAIASAMTRLADDPVLRREMGAAGQDRVIARFDRDKLAAAMVAFYREQLER